MTSDPMPGAPSGPLAAWIDASAGVAGDMVLGALVDAGAGLGDVQSVVDAVLPSTVRLSATQVLRSGLRATKVDVSVLVEDQPHRPWADVRRLLVEAAVPERVRTRSLAVFDALAKAEARVHGVSPDDVDFHEVGAWDSIADVVGVAAALDLLGVHTVTASHVSLGSGSVEGAHGLLPVPSPATLELAAGWDVQAGGRGELATPTGMALVTTLAERCESLPLLRMVATGVGAGTRDLPGRPNVVRVALGARTAQPRPQEELWILEANIDDLDPRVWPDVLVALLEAGAADAWLAPVIMKKGRPAHTLSVLCTPVLRERLRAVVFSTTTTFGIRDHPVGRTALDRSWRTIEVGALPVRIKIAVDDDGRITQATPELEDARTASRSSGVPLRRVLDEASSAASAAGIRVGAVCPPDRSAPAPERAGSPDSA
jgi:uncharacterized protein (TIGR00299 family) protein